MRESRTSVRSPQFASYYTPFVGKSILIFIIFQRFWHFHNSICHSRSCFRHSARKFPPFPRSRCAKNAPSANIVTIWLNILSSAYMQCIPLSDWFRGAASGKSPFSLHVRADGCRSATLSNPPDAQRISMPRMLLLSSNRHAAMLFLYAGQHSAVLGWSGVPAAQRKSMQTMPKCQKRCDRSRAVGV